LLLLKETSEAGGEAREAGFHQMTSTTQSDAFEIFCRNCTQIISADELRAKLAENRPLRVKLGVDPTAPDIHLGHTVALTKLRQFQEAGHQAILIIGDFTALIGDPSGRSATRPHLTYEEVMSHALTYQDQAFKILDREQTRIVFNGEWFRSMSFEEVLRLNSRVTLQQLLQREDFKSRIDRSHPIRLHEIQYPIMQGWDSVQIQADIELGGNDQLFNILVGRDLQKEEGMPQQVAMLLPLLEGLDGTQKMSKSLGNAVGVTEAPENMFGKLLSIPDSVMGRYYELLLCESLPAHLHPMQAKKDLAFRIVARYHSTAEAKRALEDFDLRFSKRDLQHADLPTYSPEENTRDIVSIVMNAYGQCFGIIKSRSEVRRLIEQGSIRWQGEKITDTKTQLETSATGVLKLDKTHAVRLE
jgi:tyrosyl-tRNA synthetase